MLKALRLLSVLAVLAAALLGTTAVLAQGDDTHIFGTVFIDTNLNGVWDVGEEGYMGEWEEYWDEDDEVFVQHYVGTPVSLNPGDPDDIITLKTAGARELEEDEEDLCTYLDWIIGDDDEVNPAPMRPCNGTFGLRPAGPKEMIWEVTLTVPAGYMATSPNPQHVEITSDTPVVEFGIAPTGAGGPTAAPIALRPVTGGTVLGILAFAAALTCGGVLFVGKKPRR